ncbi:gag-pol polyprotein [Trifolium medium]|uniref:Gag-pol polyprotein n=1 Tax=Trifolium medium TaxID=97028 RepID=A0A392RH12_9FABA|nr:gag-pol polyprotein [Trifolium medium]
MMESINVVIDDSAEEKKTYVAEDVVASDPHYDAPEIEKEPEENSEISSSEANTAPPKKAPSVRVQKNHPQELIIGNLDQGIATRRTNELVLNSCFVSKFEPKNVKEALTDEF